MSMPMAKQPAFTACLIRCRFRDADYDLTIRNTGRGGKVFIPYKPGRQVLSVEV